MRKNKKKISVVVPCLNEEKNIPLLVPEIMANIPKGYDWEIILVNDGSSDNTESKIAKLCLKNKKVKGIFLYRRFGHQAALMAGIKEALGDAVITMDGDFQHPPQKLGEMILLWETGNDLVMGKKKEDKTQGVLMSLKRRVGYLIWEKTTGGILIPGVSDFRLMSKGVRNYILKSKETEIFLRGIVMLAAKNPVFMDYKVDARRFGKSSYSTRVFINMFINGLITFSTVPLRSAGVVGLMVALSAGVFVFADMTRALILGKMIIEGWKTVVLLMLILNGFVIFYLGVIGEYIGVIFKEIKRRPSYLVKERLNIKK